MKSRLFHVSLLSATCILGLTAGAHAAGFYIQEQSVKGLGYAFAGSVTSIDDASTIYFNPAGMTKLDRAQVNAGVHLLLPNADLDNNGSTFDFNGAAPGGVAAISGGDGGNPYGPSPVPNLYGVMPIIEDTLWAGIGVSAPFGLASKYDAGWFGRFDSTKTELKVINIAPTVAVKATDWLSVGAGIDIQYADAELKQAASNVISEGESTLKGKDWTVGYNIGLTVKPIESTEIGAHYRSGITHELDGSIKLTGITTGFGLANFDIGGTADLDLPDMATFGIAHQLTPQLRLMGQATWFGWSNFEDITATDENGTERSSVPQNYQNTWAFAIGAEYDLNDMWTVRGGYQYDETPTTDEFRTSRTPDGDRNWFSLGATYHLNENIDLDLAATYIDVAEGTINVSRNSNLNQTVAETDGQVGILAIGLNYKF